MGNPVFLLLEDGQPLRKRIDAANATADRLGVLAALGQDETVAAELLRLGAVPASAKGEPTLLHQAAQAGALRSLETLIHLGAVTKSKTSAGDTPLHLAARNGRTAIVERLIAAKAPLNADNAMKDTPLHLAAAGCHAEACRLLVEAGASVHASNDRDQTPLFRALLADCTPALELLMARRGDFGFNDFIRVRLLVRKAATKGLGEASFGRVYGFVYFGLGTGLATAPLIFGAIMDGGKYPMLWVGVAVFQVLAVFSALRVGRNAHSAHAKSRWTLPAGIYS